MKNILLITFLTTFLFGCGKFIEDVEKSTQERRQENTTQAVAESAPEVASPEYRLTAKQLCSAHESNSIATEEAYKDRTIEITGIVDGVEKEVFSDKPIIKLAGAEMSMCEVHASPSDSYRAKIGSLRKGNRITLICVGGDSDENPFGPKLNNCAES